MEIQFQHANPYAGRESVVLRIDGLQKFKENA